MLDESSLVSVADPPSRAPADRAFADLYERHAVEVYQFVHRRCRDHALAEDVTQDTFVRAGHSFDDPAAIRVGWLIQVARNRLLDIVRREVRYEGKLRLVGAREAEVDEPSAVVDRVRMTAALEGLRVEHRVVLMLHYVDGFTIPELADELGRTPKSIEALVTRARRALRKELERSDA
jgi:RNA polymerase sigma-70 factor (ECF subfamily)